MVRDFYIKTSCGAVTTPTTGDTHILLSEDTSKGGGT